MKVRYIYSACVEIQTASTRILCDPWFTDGAFEGSWFHYPTVKNPLKILRKPDYIYISHIHSDHYDPLFLKKILKKYKNLKIIVPNFKRNYLLNRMKFDGIPARPLDFLKVGKTNIHLVPNEEDISDIDSAIIVNENKSTVMGLVDCVYNRKFHLNLKKIISKYSSTIDLLMVPHSGANDFPHTHFNYNSQKNNLMKWSKRKKKANIERYLNWCKIFKSQYHLPYAGKYIIGGKNIKFNKYYGITDPIDIKKIDRKAIILEDHGGEINLLNGKISKERTKGYNQKRLNKYLKKIKKFKYNYEKDIQITFKNINFRRLLGKSYFKAMKLSKVKKGYFYCFELLENNRPTRFSALFNTNIIKKPQIEFNKKLRKPGTIISIDYRLLFGLLTGLYHWDNASVGSLYTSRRLPYKYNKDASNFLDFLSI